MQQPLRVGIIGMGGFAAAHHDVILALEEAGECRLVCGCDPRPADFAERQSALRFRERGVRMFDDYLAMLDACGGELDLLTVPTPIPLHAPMHRAGVERGIPVYLEKPPTLDYDELQRMLAVEASARRDTMVGFSYIVEEDRQALKRRIVVGEFGRVRCISVLGMWPRSSVYYGRAPWAGRLQLDGRLVLDSVLGNAMGHSVHSSLFWGGVQAVWGWGFPREVRAEMYRAHPIEGTDTVIVKAALEEGPEVRLALSHAFDGTAYDQEWVECEQAVITRRSVLSPELVWQRTMTVTHADGRSEEMAPLNGSHLHANMRQYFAYLRGEADRPLTRLEDTRPFVALHSLAYLAACRITSVPPTSLAVRDKAGERPERFVAIDGLPDVAARFVETGALPSEQGVPWAKPGGRAVPADLPGFVAGMHAMIEEAAASGVR